MPVYEYACKSCGNHLEVSQTFTDPPLTECPVCGGPLRKVFNSIGIVLKGSGFYRTDSRMPSPKAGGKSEKGESGSGGGEKSDSKAEPKSDSAPKPDTKSETKSESKSDSAAKSA